MSFRSKVARILVAAISVVPAVAPPLRVMERRRSGTVERTEQEGEG
jgi:hypothetical protein